MAAQQTLHDSAFVYVGKAENFNYRSRRRQMVNVPVGLLVRAQVPPDPGAHTTSSFGASDVGVSTRWQVDAWQRHDAERH